MAKTPKKRANTKGAAKKAAPKKVHKKVKKPARSCLAAVVEQEAKKREVQRQLDAASQSATHFGVSIAALDQPRQQAENEAATRFVNDGLRALQPKRYRFRDAITGLFVRAAAALKRPFTTVRERVR